MRLTFSIKQLAKRQRQSNDWGGASGPRERGVKPVSQRDSSNSVKHFTYLHINWLKRKYTRQTLAHSRRVLSVSTWRNGRNTKGRKGPASLFWPSRSLARSVSPSPSSSAEAFPLWQFLTLQMRMIVFLLISELWSDSLIEFRLSWCVDNISAHTPSSAHTHTRTGIQSTGEECGKGGKPSGHLLRSLFESYQKRGNQSWANDEGKYIHWEKKNVLNNLYFIIFDLFFYFISF